MWLWRLTSQTADEMSKGCGFLSRSSDPLLYGPCTGELNKVAIMKKRTQGANGLRVCITHAQLRTLKYNLLSQIDSNSTQIGAEMDQVNKAMDPQCTQPSSFKHSS